MNTQYYGTIFSPELRYTPEQKAVWRARLSVYAGKNQDGTYKPSVNVKVTA